jgi:hypothetical protein
MAWEAITERWHVSISKDAIAEAVRLAREALINHATNSSLTPPAADRS